MQIIKFTILTISKGTFDSVKYIHTIVWQVFGILSCKIENELQNHFP